MELTAALAFLDQNHHVVLSTRKADVGPQMSPVVAAVVDGRVMISTRAPAAKVRNLERHPAASALVLSDRFFGRWVQLDGLVEIIRQPEALELLERIYRIISGEHQDWAEYRAAMVSEERVVLALAPDHAAGLL